MNNILLIFLGITLPTIGYLCHELERKGSYTNTEPKDISQERPSFARNITGPDTEPRIGG